MSESLLYVLQVECVGVVAGVILNGVDVFADWEGASRLVQTKVNPYIVEGPNALEVLVTPMTDDDGVPLPVERMLRVALLRGPHGADPGPAGRIAGYTWDEAQSPVEPGVLTGVWGRQFTVSPEQAFGPWAWQLAPAVAPQPDDAAALVQLAAEVHAALSARDVRALLQLTRLRDAEMARALDIPEAEYQTEQADYWAEWFGAPGFALDPFDPTALAAVPQARGRLVRVTDPYGGPPLQGGDGTRRFAFAFAACPVDGQWVIAR